MMESRRIASLDILRGIAVIFILFFHSSIFNYANIHKIDFSDPPILIVLMSFMAIWGGLFIVYSSVVNTYMLMQDDRREQRAGQYKYLFMAGAAYILFHFLLNIFLGRWTVDFVNNRPDLTAVAGSLRNMRFTMPQPDKLFEGSSLSTIGINLMALALFMYLLSRGGGLARQKRNYWILGLSGSLIMLLSFARVYVYPSFDRALADKDFLASLFYSFTVANPYPLIPYIAYGLMGMMIGMMAYNGRRELLARIVAPLGSAFFVYGIIGMMNLEKSISKPDYFWYFKTNFELGVFMLMLVFSLLVIDRAGWLTSRLPLVKWFSRVSLTIYMLETTTSEILRLIGLKLLPSWNETINGCLLFGAVNVAFWSLILFLWSKAGFRYSIEYMWVALFKRFGKPSTKLAGM